MIKPFLLFSLLGWGLWMLVDCRTAIVGSFVLTIPWLMLLYIVVIMSIDAPLSERFALLILGWANPANLATYSIMKPAYEELNENVKNMKKKKKKKKLRGAEA